jgi:branched-chain amino acid aminotransferase
VPVLTDNAGNVTEGPGFNIFSVRDGALATPDRGVFEGMTRRCVIELAQELGVGCQLRAVPAAEVREADEVFITSTAGGIMPVSVVDDLILSNGRPGPITGRFHDLYWERHESTWLGEPIPYRNQP